MRISDWSSDVCSSDLALGRAVDTDTEANAFVQRQDGWVLTRAGVPTVMVGGSFANMKILEDFLRGPYHKPGDDLDRPLVLEGAAEEIGRASCRERVCQYV